MASLTGWTEAILFSVALVAILAIVVGNMNGIYNQNYNVPFTDTSNSTQTFIQQQNNTQAQVAGGQVDFTAINGFSLSSSWGIAKDLITVSWAFLSGGWIEQTIMAMNLGPSGAVIGLYLHLIYFASVIFALLYVLFKVVI